MSARIVRAGEEGRHVVPAEVVDARAEAERIVGEARAGAEREVAGARARAEAIRSEAEAQGLEAAEARAASVVAEAAAARDRILADAEAQIPRLAVAVAERLVGRALDADPALVRGMVEGVVERARRAKRLELRVHPDDVEHVRHLADDASRVVTLEPDPTLTRGGCVLRSDVGEVDARLEVRLDAVEQALRSIA